MNRNALFLINICFEWKFPSLDLGNCGLTDRDFFVGNILDIELRKCTHLTSLILSNSWFDWDIEKNIFVRKFSLNKGDKNIFYFYPPAISSLKNLTIFICAGEATCRWGITGMFFLSNLNKLKLLNLSFNRISSLSGFTAHSNLETLDVSQNEIKNLRGLDDLKKLENLNISHNKISVIKNVSHDLKLKTLNISYNLLTELNGTEHFNLLSSIDASHNLLQKVTDLKTFSHLKNLNISSNQIENIIEIKQVDSLETLNFSNNLLIELKVAEVFINLKHFDLSYNLINKICELNNLPALEVLNLSNNFISELKEINSLNCLRYLDVSGNQLETFKGLIVSIPLETLILNNNRFKRLDSLGSLNCLKVLDVSENRIEVLPDLHRFGNLEILTVRNNKLISLKGLSFLAHLKSLDISYNSLKELDGLNQLRELESILANNNQIEELGNFEGFSRLESINISNNKIKDITPLINKASINFVRPLKIVLEDSAEAIRGTINLKDNPLVIPAIEIVSQGNDAILNWFKARAESSVINSESKCILFGNGGSGKTTLSNQLRGYSFLGKNQRTHGILIQKWIIKREEIPKALWKRIFKSLKEYELENPDKPKVEIPENFVMNLWDFGGQEYYHATHRLFMSSNVMYLLLWEQDTNRHNDEKGEYPISYWVKNIQHFSSQNVIVYIQNKVKKYCAPTDGEFRFKLSFRENKNSVAKRDYESDFIRLKNGILNLLSDLSYLGELFPKVYDDIRIALKNDTRPYITFDDYKTICNQNDHTESRIMNDVSQLETLIRFLDDIGAVICFRYRKSVKIDYLREIVFTSPVWLTNIIYEILEKGRAEFDSNHVSNIVLKYGLDKNVWIEIMKQFELIFEIEREGKTFYVVPQYLSVSCDNETARKLALKGKKMIHSFTLKYREFLPKSNFLRLISKYGRHSINYLYWKKGLLFFLRDKTVFAECINDENSGFIIITVEDNDPFASKEIFTSLVEIDNSGEILVSVDKSNYVDVKKLKEKVTKGNVEIESDNGTTLPVSLFNPLFAQKDTNIFDSSNVAFEKIVTIFLASSSELKKERDKFEIFIGRENKELKEKNIFLKLVIWEDFLDAMSQTRLQDRYNTAIEGADIFIMLYSTKVGVYTAEEFEKAFKQFKETNKPRIYTYFKKGEIYGPALNRLDIISLLDFQDKLEKLGHFTTVFKHHSEFHLHFKKQLQKLYRF